MLQIVPVTPSTLPLPKTKAKRAKKVKAVSVEKNWGLESPQGNQAMKRKGESLLRKLNKVKEKEGSLSEYIHVFETYLKSYTKGCATKTCGEAKKGEIKEKVKAFVAQAAASVNLAPEIINDICARHF